MKKIIFILSNLICITSALYLVDINIFYDYTNIGDLIAYKSAFEAIYCVELENAFPTFTAYTGSIEPLSFVVFFIFSNINISFELFNSLLNGTLLLILLYNLRNTGVNKYFYLSILLLNFYILILFYIFIRLKIAIIFILFAYNFKNYILKKNILLFLAFLSHFQMLIFLVAQLKNINYKKNILIIILISIISILLVSIFGDFLAGKFLWYYQNNLIFPYRLISLIIIASILYKKDAEFISVSIIMLVIALLIGDQRINILYFIFLLLNINLLKMSKISFKYLFILFLSLYFDIKGILYIFSIYDGENYLSD